MKMTSCYVDSMFLRRKYLIHKGLFNLPIWNAIIRVWFIVFSKAWIKYFDCLINVLVLVINIFCFLFYCIWNIWVDDFHRGMSLNPHLVKSWIWYWNFGNMCLPNSLEILHPEIAVVHWIARNEK